MNNYYYLAGLVLFLVILFALSEFDPIESSIPPTPAFRSINGTGGNITATAYNDNLELIDGSGISLTFNHLAKELTITATGNGGVNNTISSLGIGHSIVSGQVLIDHQLKGIFCAGDLLCSTNSTDLRISYTDGIGTGEANTQSSPTHANTLVLPKSGVNLPIKGIACGGSIICSNNSTDITLTYTATGGGNMTSLNDGGDVTITSPAPLSTLYYVGTQWIDKIFSINTQSASNDVFITGINNQTGAITTNQFSVNTQISAVDKQITGINNVTGEITRNTFSVNTKTCSGTDKVSSIDNSTGNVICTADVSGGGTNALLDGSSHTDTVAQGVTRGSIIYGDATPSWNELVKGTSGHVLTAGASDISWAAPSGGTARESLVASWGTDKTWANIGISFVNIYLTGTGDPFRIDTNGKTTVTLMIDWTKVGVGTQKCKVAIVGTENTILIMHTNLVTGVNTNATVSIPVAQQNTIANYKLMCLSSTSTDDPVFLSGQISLR